MLRRDSFRRLDRLENEEMRTAARDHWRYRILVADPPFLAEKRWTDCSPMVLKLPYLTGLKPPRFEPRVRHLFYLFKFRQIYGGGNRNGISRYGVVMRILKILVSDTHFERCLQKRRSQLPANCLLGVLYGTFDDSKLTPRPRSLFRGIFTSARYFAILSLRQCYAILCNRTRLCRVIPY